MMKSFIVLLALVLSSAVHAVSHLSPDADRTFAELMGDLAYFQVDNSPRLREKISMLLNKAESEVAKGKAEDSVLATKLAEKISLFLRDQSSKEKYDIEKFKSVVDAYEKLVKASLATGANDAGFLMLDFRYRYLSSTISAVNDGSVIMIPMDRSVEESYVDTDQAMKQVAMMKKDSSAVKKWSFLRRNVADSSRYAIPALANSMTLRIAGELAAAGQPVVASVR